MSIKADIAIQALHTMAEQARMAVEYMNISHSNPHDIAVANKLIDGSEDLLTTMLHRANQD